MSPRSPGPEPYIDESVRAFPELDRGFPVVVFGDHGFCAGRSMSVQKMPGPHMHSQIELNLVLDGGMTYWFDGREMALGPGQLVIFWGMIPHQVIDCAPATRFVVLYVPMSIFLKLPSLGRLRDAVFSGAVLQARQVQGYDADLFCRWRDDLLTGDDGLAEIVQAELTARVLRLARDGWEDLRGTAPLATDAAAHDHDHDRVRRVEAMVRFIGERGLDNIRTGDVARAADLHPNYAMTLFRRAMGLTIKQAITRHRLDTAQSMLIATDLPAATIAFDCGFGSLSSFYKAFFQRFRASPAAFRRAFAGPLERAAGERA